MVDRIGPRALGGAAAPRAALDSDRLDAGDEWGAYGTCYRCSDTDGEGFRHLERQAGGKNRSRYVARAAEGHGATAVRAPERCAGAKVGYVRRAHVRSGGPAEATGAPHAQAQDGCFS